MQGLRYRHGLIGEHHDHELVSFRTGCDVYSRRRCASRVAIHMPTIRFTTPGAARIACDPASRTAWARQCLHRHHALVPEPRSIAFSSAINRVRHGSRVCDRIAAGSGGSTCLRCVGSSPTSARLFSKMPGYSAVSKPRLPSLARGSVLYCRLTRTANRDALRDSYQPVCGTWRTKNRPNVVGRKGGGQR